jgi:hypothetical protein
MMLAATLLTPMILAAEPVRLEVLDQTYDHQTQTSAFNGNPDKRIRLAYSNTRTNGYYDGRMLVPTDGDTD